MCGTLGIAVAASVLVSCVSVPALDAQNVQIVQNVQDVPLRTILVTGAKELSPDTIRHTIPAEVGVPLTQPTGQIAEAVEKRYQDDGYTFARVDAAFDPSTGA